MTQLKKAFPGKNMPVAKTFLQSVVLLFLSVFSKIADASVCVLIQQNDFAAEMTNKVE